MILDIIVLVLLALSAFIGYKKGLVGILISLVSLILSIVLAIFLQGSVTNYLYNDTTIGTTIEESIKGTIENEINRVDENQETQNDKNTYISMFFETDEIQTLAVDESANKITMFILKGISFVGIFILVFIICYILRMVLNIVFKLPILNSINKVGGVSLNVVKAVFKIWIVLAIVSFVAFVPTFEGLLNMIDSSLLTKFLYNNNLIVNILKATLGL